MARKLSKVDREIRQENRAWMRAAKAERKAKREGNKRFSAAPLMHAAKNPKMHWMYRERCRNLAEMGYKSYADYLKSPEWRSIRGRVLSRFPNCQLCDSALAEAVHHQSYSRVVLEGKDLSALVSVCHSCHRAAEFSGDNKRPADEVRGLVRRMKAEARSVAEARRQAASLDRELDALLAAR